MILGGFPDSGMDTIAYSLRWVIDDVGKISL
jgi:hypothetical protein